MATDRSVHTPRMASSRSSLIFQEMEELAISHGVPVGKGTRRMLEPRHVVEFGGNSLFEKFARTVCAANAVPRKELFEAWTMALFVYDAFPEACRIADVACSHGLVSWALLVLYEYGNNHTNNKYTSTNTNHHDANKKHNYTSVVCIDVKMPPSAEKLATAMSNEWPDLNDRWDYVEGSVDGIVPCPSTLIVGVHACSQLSDEVISIAIRGNSSLALVPCCHSKKSLLPEQRKLLPTTRTTTTPYTSTGIPGISFNLADCIDNNRIQRLQEAGMEVHEARIPEIITPKNRIILAAPPPLPILPCSTASSTTLLGQHHPDFTTCTTTNSTTSKPHHRTRSNQTSIFATVTIPIGNTIEARATVRSLAGRAASNQRKAPPPPTMGLCLFLPASTDTNDASGSDVSSSSSSGGGGVGTRSSIPKEETVTEEKLSAVAHALFRDWNDSYSYTYSSSMITVKSLNAHPYHHAASGRCTLTFCVVYNHISSKQQAKELHILLCHKIPVAFPGVSVRQIPK